MDTVHAAKGDKDLRIGVSRAADVVGVFDARVGYHYLAADQIGPPVGDRQRGAGRCHGNPQQRRKKYAWLHIYSMAQGLWGRSVYNDHAESKINQSKFLVLTMNLVSPHPRESTPP